MITVILQYLFKYPDKTESGSFINCIYKTNIHAIIRSLISTNYQNLRYHFFLILLPAFIEVPPDR